MIIIVNVIIVVVLVVVSIQYYYYYYDNFKGDTMNVAPLKEAKVAIQINENKRGRKHLW